MSARARRRLALGVLTAALALTAGGGSAAAAATGGAAPPPASAAECAAWGARVDRLSARIRAAVAVSRRARTARQRAAALAVARRLARGRAGYRGLIGAGCTTPPATPPPQGASGLTGTVVISPSTPVCVVGRPCSAPAAGVSLVFERAGRAVATTTAGATGGYRVALAPGPYTVRAPGAAPGGGIQVVGGSGDAVIVPDGRYARVDLTLDVGIR